MTRLTAALLLCLAAAACKPAEPAQPAAATAAVAAPAPAAAPAAKPVAAAAAAPKPHAMEGCAEPSGEPIQHPDSFTVKDPTSGETVTQAGTRLTASALVKVGDLLAKPSDYAGKTVRLEGNVSSMCFHRRDWFSIQEEGRNGVFVRVVTAPSFLVPEGSIGKKAVAEGVVEVVEVPAETARHYAKNHQLGDPTEVKDEPTRAVTLRATGAEFR